MEYGSQLCAYGSFSNSQTHVAQLKKEMKIYIWNWRTWASSLGDKGSPLPKGRKSTMSR